MSPDPMAGHLGVLDRGYGHKKEPRPLTQDPGPELVRNRAGRRGVVTPARLLIGANPNSSPTGQS